MAAAALVGLVGLPGAPAVADPTPAPVAVPSPVPGKAVCTVDDRLSAIVGLVATTKGYAVAVRSNDTGLNIKVYPLTSSCKLTGTTVPYSGNPRGGATDPEDLALSRDGADYWVADSGDDLAHPDRDHIAIWKLPVNRDTGTIYRFTFPDGAHDAETLLLSGDGTPVLVTRVLSGPAGIYVPSAALDPSGNEVPLKKVGEFTPQKTGTANLLGPGGELTVTGGAVSPDGKRVVLRTVSDAYEWDVPDGDVVKAITTGTPRITPLGDSGVGRAITYSADGTSFLTVPDVSDGTDAKILQYAPAKAVPPVKSTAAAAKDDDGKSWLATVSLRQLTILVVGVGVLGLIMVIGGILGMKYGRARPRGGKRPAAGTGRVEPDGEPGRGRRYPRQADPGRDSDPFWSDADPPDPYGSRRRVPPPADPPHGGRVYGGGRPGGAASHGSGDAGRDNAGVYGRPAPDEGGVYGRPGRDAGRADWPPQPRAGGRTGASGGQPAEWGTPGGYDGPWDPS